MNARSRKLPLRRCAGCNRPTDRTSPCLRCAAETCPGCADGCDANVGGFWCTRCGNPTGDVHLDAARRLLWMSGGAAVERLAEALRDGSAAREVRALGWDEAAEKNEAKGQRKAARTCRRHAAEDRAGRNG